MPGIILRAFMNYPIEKLYKFSQVTTLILILQIWKLAHWETKDLPDFIPVLVAK